MAVLSTVPAIGVCENVPNPEAELDTYIAQLRVKGQPYGLLYLTYTFDEYWADHRAVRLSAMYLIDSRRDPVSIRAAVAAAGPPFRLDKGSALASYATLEERYRAWVARHGAADIVFSDGCLLEPVYIPKPWGREVWYTGIERRGVSYISSGSGRTILPWALSVAPRRLTNDRNEGILLVKVLEPFSDPLYGNLYYEIHPRKQEVYIVTDIDRDVWPDGIGEIRVGINQGRRRFYKDARAFREDLAKTLMAYRHVRARIDRHITAHDKANRLSLTTALTPHDKRRLDRYVPVSLKKSERKLRGALESFLNTEYVTAGDIVKILPNTPHCVQHGVRCLGYQTQDYDRLIMAFSQKVLTQADWDIEEAVTAMMLSGYAPTRPGHSVMLSPEIVKEHVARLRAFAIVRLSLPRGSSYRMDNHTDYSLLYTSGDGRIQAGGHGDGTPLSGEMVFLIPRSVSGFSLTASGNHPLTALMGFPSLAGVRMSSPRGLARRTG
jgi:hypothetical protein